MEYVMSDIHGHLANFEAVLHRIDLQPDDTLYVLGDVLNRHPAGIQILKRMMKNTDIF